jgi:DMSO reductase family type II enzyme heme b subunit
MMERSFNNLTRVATDGRRPTTDHVSLARRRALALVAVLLGAGMLLNVLNVPLAASAANTVDVLHVTQGTPLDPQSPLWDQAKEAQIPLSAQQIYQPGGGSVREVKVKAIEDGHSIAFRISWADDTRNDVAGVMPSDAAAIQLPMDPTHLPYQCMGMSDSRVNIWQWKAAYEKQGLENEGALAMENAGVRNLTSDGICKAVDTVGISPQVKSFHDGKEWHVVFYRGLGKGDTGSAPLTRDANSSIAFAVWNGARGETRGMKAVSTWNTLQFQAPESGSVTNLITMAVVIAISAGGVVWAMRRFAA